MIKLKFFLWVVLALTHLFRKDFLGSSQRISAQMWMICAKVLGITYIQICMLYKILKRSILLKELPSLNLMQLGNKGSVCAAENSTITFSIVLQCCWLNAQEHEFKLQGLQPTTNRSYSIIYFAILKAWAKFSSALLGAMVKLKCTAFHSMRHHLGTR